MCGIGGIWRRTGLRADEQQLRRMMAAQRHRGPEAAAWARLDRGALVLGFLLLGFTGGGRAGQPIYNEDRSIALVFNGEIYDHEVIRRRLQARGHRFETTSDSEVLVHLYEEHGLQMLDQLNGEFAFVLFDASKGELLLVRDRFGIKPLQYALHDGAFVFASEAKAIHALPGFDVALDPAFFAGPGLGIAECSMTAFSGIRSLRPGHVMRVTRTTIEQTPYDVPSFGGGLVGGAPLPLHAAADVLRSTLTRAVTRRLEGDPPIAVSLSSGVDSTIVCGLMAGELGRRGRKLTAFSLGYDGAEYDESAAARRTADHYGASFERVLCTPEMLVDGFLPGIHAVEIPTTGLSTTARLALTGAIRAAGFKAVMSGEGSDELFGGYPYFGIEALWRLAERGAGARASAERGLARFRELESRSRGVFWEERGVQESRSTFGYASAYAARIPRVARLRRLLFTRHWREATRDTPLALATRELDPQRLGELHPFDASRLVARSVLGSLVIPSLGDRVEMAHSLEGRAPYLDLDVVRLAYRLGEAHCIDPQTFQRKRVLRHAFAAMLPGAHVPPAKHTAMAPSFADFARVPRGRELLEMLLDDRAIRRTGIFDPWVVKALRLTARCWPAGDARRRASVDAMIGYVASTQALHAVHVDDVLGLRRSCAPLACFVDRSPERLPANPACELGGAS